MITQKTAPGSLALKLGVSQENNLQKSNFLRISPPRVEKIFF